MIHKSKVNLLCKKLILNNSVDEEEKSVIHKLNQVIAMFFNYWKKSDMDYID